MIRFGSVILGYREGNVFALPLREFSSNGTYVGSVVRLPTLRVWVSGMGRLPILVVRRMIGFHPCIKIDKRVRHICASSVRVLGSWVRIYKKPLGLRRLHICRSARGTRITQTYVIAQPLPISSFAQPPSTETTFFHKVFTIRFVLEILGV